VLSARISITTSIGGRAQTSALSATLGLGTGHAARSRPPQSVRRSANEDIFLEGEELTMFFDPLTHPLNFPPGPGPDLAAAVSFSSSSSSLFRRLCCARTPRAPAVALHFIQVRNAYGHFPLSITFSGRITR